MKSIKSMPAITGPSFRPLHASNGAPLTAQAGLQRSQSMGVNKPQERMRLMARRVPFMAFPGVGSQLGVFARSFSRANLARMGSRVASHANLGASYGSMDFGGRDGSIGGGGSFSLGAAPSPLERDFSEAGSTMFGNTFEEELEMMQPGFTVALGMAVFTAVLASFQVGYNSGVLNVPQSTIMASLHLSTLAWSVAVAIFCIGGLVGSMGGGKAADRIGRKNFLIANNVLFIVGGLMESLAGGIEMLCLGRLLIGVGCGGATVVVPMYLGEIAPANLRGSLGTMNQFAMVIGILVANILGKPLGGIHSWRYLLGLCLIPSLLQIIMAATLLESPLWLLNQGGSSSKNRQHAEEVLSALRGTDDVEFDIECMLASVNDEDDDEDDGAAAVWDDEEEGAGCSRAAKDIFSDNASSSFHDRQVSTSSSVAGAQQLEKGSIARLAAVHRSHSLWAPEHRRPLLIGFGLQLVQQFSGINAVFFYSTAFFTSAHMSDPWLGSVLASSVNVLATGLSIYLIERMGRRKLLLISTMGMMLSCVGLTYALQAMQPSGGFNAPPPPAWVSMMSVIMVLVFVSFFEIGLGPIPWLIGAEIFPNRVRSEAMAISSTINWLSNFAVGMTFPSLSLALGPLSFAPFGVVLLIAFVLEYRFVPETQGKSLEEIQEEFLAQAGLNSDEDEDDDAESRRYGGSSVGDATPNRGAGLSDFSDEDEHDHDADRPNGRQSYAAHGSPQSADAPATPIPEGEEATSGSGREEPATAESSEYDDEESHR